MRFDDSIQELVNRLLALRQKLAELPEEQRDDAIFFQNSHPQVSALLADVKERLSRLSEDEQIEFLEWFTQTDTGAVSGAGMGDRVFVEVIRGGQ